MSVSPYAEALGDRIGELAPQLQIYFSHIPAGQIGVGKGVFDRVGTPRRWLWPLMRVLARDGVIAPVWERDVRFTVTNSPVKDAVAATRTFHFADGDWSMTDEIGNRGGSLADVVGRSRRIVAVLDAAVANGELWMTSTRLAVRFGGVRLWVPRALAPRLTLSERFDEADGRQHVSLVLDSPLLGRLYEYSGWFRYEVRPRQTEAAGDQ